ncbi:MAG: ABC transporter permease [Cytophagia bacterium]|nr:MAG: ABC transporter permease [Cytophagales bacterium]TAG05746.1 MAG: ABC transporter permease [Cytophagia bacterium]TAG43642.1 MAG: ABC transporter permease [Cytophagia bacterium]TAH28867.1 MAG: ABC transporter permease [Cytophagales bacterium]
MKKNWWKILTVFLMIYTILMGFLGDVPHLPILNESIRNLYFHVPMWFGMILILSASVYHSILYLKSQKEKNDFYAVESVNIGILFGILGIITGMVWAKPTWGAYWSGDPKQNASAIALLMYLAYSVLRSSITDEQTRAKFSAVYAVFAFAVFIPLIFILPRLTDSLHPGNGGNPGFNVYDQAKSLRLVFYPAVLAWTLVGWWIVTLRVRIRVWAFKMMS